MQTRVSSQVTIHDTPSRVFTYLTELKRHYLWNPHLKDVKPLIKVQADTIYRTRSWLFGIEVRGLNKIVNYVPNKELGIENDTGLLHYKVNYTLSRKGKNTVLECDTEVFADSKAWAFAKPVMKQLARRELQADLELLKIAVEQRF